MASLHYAFMRTTHEHTHVHAGAHTSMHTHHMHTRMHACANTLILSQLKEVHNTYIIFLLSEMHDFSNHMHLSEFTNW